MPFLTKRAFVSADVGTEGTFTSGNVAEADNTVHVYDLAVRPIVDIHDRDPNHLHLGTLAAIPGARYLEFSFGVDLMGSGTGGSAPKLGKFLRGCGNAATTNAGSASIGSTVPDLSKQKSTATIMGSSAVAGTFAGTKSGTLEITLQSVTTNTNLVFLWWFYPADGSAAETTTTTHTSTSSQTPSGTTYLDGVTLATTMNPGSSTTGAVVGDRWTVQLVSDQQESVHYRNTSTAHSVLDMAVYYVNESGNTLGFRAHSCRGNVSVTAAFGQPARLNFTFMGVMNEGTAITTDTLTGVTNGGVYDTTAPPPFLGVTTTLGGSATQCYGGFTFDLGAQVAMRQCAGQTTGYKSALITGFKPTGTIDPEMVLTATDGVGTAILEGTNSEFVATWGTVTGNIVTLTIPKLQRVGMEIIDREGQAAHNIPFRANMPAYDAGAEYHSWELLFT